MGTRITIRLPLSLAMFNGTVLSVNGVRYVIPNTEYRETVSFFDSDVVEQEAGHRLLRRGDEILHVVHLSSLLRVRKGSGNRVDLTIGRQIQNGDRRIALVTESEGRVFALIVDEILSQQQVVQKKFGPEARQIRFTTGGTILGDGHVALILDTAQLMRSRMAPMGSLQSA
jgi:two-component system chemotaxis sensor kinase CheA